MGNVAKHRGDLEQRVDEARHALAEVDGQIRAMVRQRPVVALLTAIGVGYVLARVSARI